jgi:hypothetical protein
MPVMPRLSVHILGYVDGEGMLDARLSGSSPLAQISGAGDQQGELMRCLAELIWAPHAMRHNPALSWREIDVTAVEVSASSRAGPARVRLIFENGNLARIEADDRPAQLDAALCRPVGKNTAATTASLKAAAFRPGPR